MLRRYLSPRALKKLAGELGIAVASVSVATALFYRSGNYFESRHLGIFYILLIAFVALRYTTSAAVFTAILSYCALDYYFIPPLFSLYPIEFKDLTSMIGFLVVGVVVGVQTGQMRQREMTALARERETALLNRLSASLVSISSRQEMVDTVLQSICESVGVSDAILFLHEQAEGALLPWRLPQVREAPVDEQILLHAHWVAQHKQPLGLPEDVPSVAASRRRDESPAGSPHQFALYLPVHTITYFAGVLYIAERQGGDAYGRHEAQLLVAATNLIASFLERQRLETSAFAGEALREVDRFKSTLISSVSHELKTPLAAIKATVTNLLAHDVNWKQKPITAELETIRGATERLSDNINALVDLSRLAADAWKPNQDWYELEEIIGVSVKTFSKAQRARLVFHVPTDLSQLYVDFHQLSRVFHHLLENAFAYAPEPSLIQVGAANTPTETLIWVEDSGPGVSADERKRIFEKFYRGACAEMMPTGTGLGLAIADEIVRSHAGRIWVEDVQPHGARFCLALPRRQVNDPAQDAPE